MSAADIDPESGCRIPLPRREDLDAEGQRAFDFYTRNACFNSSRSGVRPGNGGGEWSS
ncbi:MAG: hypothetical protein JWR37_159 [Mycobacterium sp.]|nr:hypothetical protein [Mycobacterium sp.]